MTFNDFMWQVSHRSRQMLKDQIHHPTNITRKEQMSYTFRFLCSLFTMEMILHTMYVVAIKDTSAWDGDSPTELSMIGVWNLVIVWLKVCFCFCFQS
jgi:D-alanyl-lipoteichoic acid acyltransferase DltB (MBOAT superfamily)